MQSLSFSSFRLDHMKDPVIVQSYRLDMSACLLIHNNSKEVASSASKGVNLVVTARASRQKETASFFNIIYIGWLLPESEIQVKIGSYSCLAMVAHDINSSTAEAEVSRCI